MQRLGDVTFINTKLNFSNYKDYAKIVVTPSENLTHVRIDQKRGTNIIKSGIVAIFVENNLNLQFSMIIVDNETDDFYTKIIDH
uniref:Uncharacterized protein n=1 Tax=Strongyloides venezuelensis TaxID=75913 RepID=A0A0K0FUK4_STRVS